MAMFLCAVLDAPLKSSQSDWPAQACQVFSNLDKIDRRVSEFLGCCCVSLRLSQGALARPRTVLGLSWGDGCGTPGGMF